MFATGALGERGRLFRELFSGVGFVDIGIMLSVLHLVELKILRSRLVGVPQIAKYMKTEGRDTGWLVLFDAHPLKRRPVLPREVKVSAGSVRVLVVDIRPEAPSRIK